MLLPSRLVEKPVQCQKCPKQFINQSRLALHLEDDCGKRFNCDICFKDFDVLLNLQRHRRRVHFGFKQKPAKKPTRNTEESFSCGICSISFTSKDKLVDHLELKHFPDQSSCPYGCTDKIENALEWKHHLEMCPSEKLVSDMIK